MRLGGARSRSRRFRENENALFWAGNRTVDVAGHSLGNVPIELSLFHVVMYVFMYVYVCMCVCTYVCIYVRMYEG